VSLFRKAAAKSETNKEAKIIGEIRFCKGALNFVIFS